MTSRAAVAAVATGMVLGLVGVAVDGAGASAAETDGRQDLRVADLLAVAPDEVHAVGFERVDGEAGTRSHARVWDGRRWTVARAPGDDTPFSWLGAAGWVGDEAWAVGRAPSDVVARWDGTGWARLDLPAPPLGATSAIAGTAPDDVWVGGARTDGGYTKPVLAHWDGAVWQRYDLAGLFEEATVRDIAAMAPDDVWVVGDRPGQPEPDRTLLAHWDGTPWTDATEVTDPIMLHAVDASGSDDAWAVGTDFVDTSEGWRARLLRWDGELWSDVAFPAPRRKYRPRDVAVVSADDVWVVGSARRAGTRTGRILHWDGDSWTKVRAPRVGAGYELHDVSGVAADDVWAAGTFTENLQPLLLHYDGDRWTRVRYR